MLNLLVIFWNLCRNPGLSAEYIWEKSKYVLLHSKTLKMTSSTIPSHFLSADYCWVILVILSQYIFLSDGNFAHSVFTSSIISVFEGKFSLCCIQLGQKWTAQKTLVLATSLLPFPFSPPDPLLWLFNVCSSTTWPVGKAANDILVLSTEDFPPWIHSNLLCQ